MVCYLRFIDPKTYTYIHTYKNTWPLVFAVDAAPATCPSCAATFFAGDFGSVLTTVEKPGASNEAGEPSGAFGIY